MSVTHKFVNPKADGADATIVRPSNWNDTHNVSIGITDLSATGTPSSSTFLRGDNTWGTPSGLSSFTSTNSTITIGGTLSAPTVDINLGNANTWTGTQTFNSSKLIAPNLNPTAASGSNTAGTSFTLGGGVSTGTGNGGSAIIQISPAGLTGSSANASLNVYSAVNTSSTVATYTYGDTTQVLTGQVHNFVLGSTAANAGLSFKNNAGTVVSQIMNTGAFFFARNSSLPAILLNSGGTNDLAIAQATTTAPGRGAIGYVANANTASITEVIGWREVIASGASPYVRIITTPDTNQTLSTESIGIQFGGDTSAATVTRQWATGALTTQREYVFIAPTYAFVSPSTITTAATVTIPGAPIAGTNATITNPYALWVQSGSSNFAGSVGIGVNPTQLLDVQGAFNSIGQIRAKGISDQGYFAADSDTANKETGYRFYKVGVFKGAFYVPASSATVTFTASSGSDIAFFSSSGFGVGSASAKLLINTSGLVTTYNNIATAGLGVPALYGIDNRTGRTTADGAPITLYTSTAANQVYRISADIFATAAVTGTANYTIAWTENSTAQAMTTTSTAINVLGTVSNIIRPDNATTITAQLTGTFTGTFSVVGIIEQLQ